MSRIISDLKERSFMNDINYHCEWRIKFAKQLFEKIMNINGILAIIIGGLVSRGYADEYSDIINSWKSKAKEYPKGLAILIN